MPSRRPSLRPAFRLSQRLRLQGSSDAASASELRSVARITVHLCVTLAELPCAAMEPGAQPGVAGETGVIHAGAAEDRFPDEPSPAVYGRSLGDPGGAYGMLDASLL